MAHPRKLIRHYVAALLVTANTAAGARVQATRVEPTRPSDLPAIGVYTLHDPVDEDSQDTAPRELKHDLELEIAAWVAHSDSYTVDDAMDDLAEQIEAAMDSDRYLGGTAGECVLMGTTMEVVQVDGKSDPLVGVMVLTYGVTYRKSPATPALADFTTVDVKQKVVGGIVNDTVPLEDTFTLETTP